MQISLLSLVVCNATSEADWAALAEMSDRARRLGVERVELVLVWNAAQHAAPDALLHDPSFSLVTELLLEKCPSDAALWTGLQSALGDVCLTLDAADDSIEGVPSLLREYFQTGGLVTGVKKGSRSIFMGQEFWFVVVDALFPRLRAVLSRNRLISQELLSFIERQGNPIVFLRQVSMSKVVPSSTVMVDGGPLDATVAIPVSQRLRSMSDFVFQTQRPSTLVPNLLFFSSFVAGVLALLFPVWAVPLVCVGLGMVGLGMVGLSGSISALKSRTTRSDSNLLRRIDHQNENRQALNIL